MVTFDEAVPVTTILTQKVQAGRAEEFERWLHSIAAEAMKFPGYLGVSVMRPWQGALEYTVIFRFQSPTALRSWIDSDARAELLRKAAPLLDGPANLEHLSGLEAWFALPERPLMKPPPRYKMALVSLAAVFPLLLAIPRYAAPLLAPLSPILRMFAVTSITIALITYLIMPALTRLLFRWLYPGSARS